MRDEGRSRNRSTRIEWSYFIPHPSSLLLTFILRRVVDDFERAPARASGVEGERAVAVLFDGAVLAPRGLLQSLARLDADGEVRRVFRAGREQRHAEAARVAQHRPVLVHRLDAEAQALVLARVAPQVLRLD